MSSLSKAYDLDWDKLTVEGYSEDRNEAVMVFNVDVTSEEKANRVIQYVVGRTIWGCHNFPPEANIVLSFDLRGQGISESRSDGLKQTIFKLIENAGVNSGVSIKILS
jgi:hypothetical protein